MNKEYKCAYQGCNKEYSNNSYLISHTRIHTGNDAT